MKLVMVIGTRPEAIKMLPLYKKCISESNISIKLIITSQHKEMLDQVLKVFDVQPDYDLNVMTEKQSLAQLTSKIVSGIEPILSQENPDYLLVHGDTTTTLAASLTAFYLKTKVVHIEAGLRTNNKFSPFPEEMNRYVTDYLARLFFCPTIQSKNNLLSESIDSKNIYVTGNTAIDAMEYTLKRCHEDNLCEKEKIILLTMHRRESIGKPMIDVFKAVKRFSEEHPEFKVIFPVHRNPLVMNYAKKYLDNSSNIELISPLEVDKFHELMAKCYLILSDSGGIQEEAPALNTPVFILRDTTERPEGIATGALKLVGTNQDDIYNSLIEIISDKDKHNRMVNAFNPYGDGKASMRIIEALKYDFGYVDKKPNEFIN